MPTTTRTAARKPAYFRILLLSNCLSATPSEPLLDPAARDSSQARARYQASNGLRRDRSCATLEIEVEPVVVTGSNVDDGRAQDRRRNADVERQLHPVVAR